MGHATVVTAVVAFHGIPRVTLAITPRHVIFPGETVAQIIPEIVLRVVIPEALIVRCPIPAAHRHRPVNCF